MPIRSNTQYGCSFIRAASTVAFGVLVTVMTSSAESRCREFDHERVFDRSDIVFAAEINYSKHDSIKIHPDYDGYIRRYIYDYRSLYVWKGDPGRVGTMHLGRGDTVSIYNHPTPHDIEIEHIKKLSMRPPRLVLVYANKNDGNIVFGGCADIPDYDYAFSQLLQLGKPSKTYSDTIFRLPDSKRIYSYI